MSKTDDTVEDPKDLKGADDIRSAVETANAEDEKEIKDPAPTDEDKDTEEDDSQDNSDDKSTDDDSEETEGSDDDDSEEEEDKKDEGEPTERKFKNLADDDDSKYIKNLENAYSNSSAEALRLNQSLDDVTKRLEATGRRVDAIVEAAQKDPELAKKLNKVLDASGVVTPDSDVNSGDSKSGVEDLESSNEDPFLVSSKTEWEEKSRQEVQEILDANPELLSNPELNKNVKHWMEVFSKEHYRVNRKVLGAGEAMKQAMKHLGVADNRKKQDVANKAKELAAPSRPTKSRTPKPKKGSGLSSEAATFADKLGVSRDKAEKFAS